MSAWNDSLSSSAASTSNWNHFLGESKTSRGRGGEDQSGGGGGGSFTSRGFRHRVPFHEASFAEDAADLKERQLSGTRSGGGGGGGGGGGRGGVKKHENPLFRTSHMMVDPSFDYQVGYIFCAQMNFI